jgi:F-type H+-transporting ATPase subunit b
VNRAWRIALAAMILVTAWSLWAWAHGAPPPPPKHEGAAETPETAEAEPSRPDDLNWTDFHKVDHEGQPQAPYIAMLINFGILAAMYYLFGRKGIATALQQRRDNIAKEIEEAERMVREAEERAKSYQAKLKRLEEEAKSARETLARTGEAERDRIVKEAEAKAERMHRDAEFIVEQEMKQIRQDLWRDAVDAAVGAAEQMLKKRVTPADQERLADDYLSDLGSRTS